MNLFKTTAVLTLAVFTLACASAHAAPGKLGDTSIVAWGNDDYNQVSDTPSTGAFTQVAGGYWYSVALKSDGSLVSWGLDNFHQVSDTPTTGAFAQVAGGYAHSVALKSDGSLVSWGWDDFNQLSDMPTTGAFLDISGGSHHSVALKSNGSLVSWGGDDYNQVSDTPTMGAFTQVAAGHAHSVALKSNGSLFSWGDDRRNQVSDTPTTGSFTQVAGGASHSVALQSDGSLVSWGRDGEYQVSGTPTGAFTQVAAGNFHNVALKSDGSLVSWGLDNFNQVSDTPTTGYFLDISGGSHHSVALKVPLSYEDLDVSGSGLDLLLQRSVTVSGDATISATMTIENNMTMTVDGRATIRSGGGIRGRGEIAGKVYAEYGSQIEATGDLALGDADNVLGFVGEGLIECGAHTVTINNRMMTSVGRTVGIDGGTLNVANGMIVESDGKLLGAGAVNGRVVNHGLIAAGAPGDDLVFSDLVSGGGSYVGSIVFNGGFSPGNSPASLNLDWATFGPDAELIMELGGTMAGAAHDHLDILGSAALDGTLKVELLGGFTPEDGQVFDLFDGTLTGQFDDIILPDLADGLSWDTGELYTFGQISVTPEPTTMILAAVGLPALLKRRRLRI
jgi:hypothetical protein